MLRTEQLTSKKTHIYKQNFTQEKNGNKKYCFKIVSVTIRNEYLHFHGRNCEGHENSIEFKGNTHTRTTYILLKDKYDTNQIPLQNTKIIIFNIYINYERQHNNDFDL